MSRKEVIFSIVPGAGGYDGIFLISQKDDFESLLLDLQDFKVELIKYKVPSIQGTTLLFQQQL